jgi:hypothetical protein
MSFVNTLMWWQWLALALIPPAIVLLYFLKLKRQPVEVPSTYLWSRTIEDLHVNSLWQRLRQSLLLFLQILLIILLMIALTRPGWRGTRLSGNRFIFLIDNSASMGANEGAGTRLEAAKQQTLQFIDQMESGDVAMIIAFSDTAQVLQNYTESRRLLRRQVEEIKLTSRRTDLREALRAASGLANPGYTRLEADQAVDESLPATLYIFSDGGFSAVPDFSLGRLEPIFMPTGTPGTDNVAVVAFSTDRNPEKPNRLQAFARLVNYGAASVTTYVELYVDENPPDVTELTIPAGGSQRAVFDLPAMEAGWLRLVVDHNDALPLDNEAYAAVNRTRRARVLYVSEGNEPLQVALTTEQAREIADVTIAAPSTLEQESHQAQAEAGFYDLIIYEDCVPVRMPRSNTLFIGRVPPGDDWQAAAGEGPPQVIDVDRVHPLTQLVEMDYVKTAKGMALEPPPGSTVLMDAVTGALAAVGPRGGFEDMVLGFSFFEPSESGQLLPNTNWPLRSSFPVFVLNALRYLGGVRSGLAAGSTAPGSAVTLRAPTDVQQLVVVDPRGERHELRRGSQATFVFTRTEALGLYQVREDQRPEVAQRFVVNLFDERESDLQPSSSLDLGHEKITGSAALAPTRREFWKWFLLLGIGLLVFEWYVYNRRVYL